MSTELVMLVWTVALAIAQVVIASAGAMTQFPVNVLVGNRETPVDGRGWVGRAQRAQRNLLESLLPFAVVVLVANAVAISNDMTMLGASLFLYARIAYAVVYIAGIPWLRTIVWTVGLAGILLILSQLI